MAMKSIVVERRIQAPPGPVWEAMTDLRGMERMLSGVDKVEVLTEGTFGVGTRWRETRTMFGKQATEEMTVTEAEAPDRYVTVADSHGMHYVSEIALRPEGDGGTMVRMTFSGSPAEGNRLGFVAKLLSGLGAKAASRALAKDLDDVAASVERRH
ncbi:MULTISPECIES: SRPBCC family protein [unclassified Streptomyces]|uniref:SRPBCC family protein n=1 Tax=unclassified Streptomyces TaxID=2593676 RepID=UPI00332678BF